jgi:hypothetical protein
VTNERISTSPFLPPGAARDPSALPALLRLLGTADGRMSVAEYFCQWMDEHPDARNFAMRAVMDDDYQGPLFEMYVEEQEAL